MQQRLVDALFSGTRHWSVSLHFNKGLAGTPLDVVAASKDMATNPAVLNAFALAISAGEGPSAYPTIPRHGQTWKSPERKPARFHETNDFNSR
jgi:hypothetical protein